MLSLRPEFKPQTSHLPRRCSARPAVKDTTTIVKLKFLSTLFINQLIVYTLIEGGVKHCRGSLNIDRGLCTDLACLNHSQIWEYLCSVFTFKQEKLY
jgi:hypothetical protein